MTAPLPSCDLVMKGGVTSGIVYPRLVTRLARRYRFARIGGSSAGAIAAAFTAAAEYERGRRGDAAPTPDGRRGFALLEELPVTLGTGLPHLFVPAPGLRHHLAALLAWVDLRGPARALGVARHVLAGSAPVVGAGALLGAGLGIGLGTWVAASGGSAGAAWASGIGVVLLVALVTLLVAAWTFTTGGLRHLERNGFGLIRGLTPAGSDRAPGGALTEWLTDTLDATAALPAGRVLTFGDLWGAEAAERHRALKLGSGDAVTDPDLLDQFAPEVDLQMITTCLSLRRAYVVPFRTRIFHWCPVCWADWFPARVVGHLVATSEPARPHRQRVDGVPTLIPDACPHHPDTPLRALPDAADLPVVVGVRMSLAFPGVISGVPMFVLDRYRLEGRWSYREVWFSDGGLTSNFPLEFFDTTLPTRPTFGITLEDPHPDTDDPAFRPVTNNSGILGRVRSIGTAGDFVEALIGVLVEWRDALTIPAAGNRDRVVEIRLPRGTGGLHLQMPPEVVAEVAARGDAAAAELEGFDWDNHRWIRYRTATTGLGDLMHEARRNWWAYEDLLARDRPPSYPVGRPEDDRAATADLLATAEEWHRLGNPAHTGSIPSPRRVFRATPDL